MRKIPDRIPASPSRVQDDGCAGGLASRGTSPNVRGMGKLLIVAGLVLVAIGIVWLVGERMGLGRLPGDIVIERENMRFYFPLMSSLIVSVVLSLVLWLFTR
jgi:hypothetical protein